MVRQNTILLAVLYGILTLESGFGGGGGGGGARVQVWVDSVVDLLKNVLRPKTNRYRKFVSCNILT